MTAGATSADGSRRTGAPLRLGTFNTLSGRSLTDGLARPAELAKALADLDVQVLALQEVDRHQPRSGGGDQAAEVAAALGAVDHRFVATVRGTPGVPGWAPGIAPGVQNRTSWPVSPDPVDDADGPGGTRPRHPGPGGPGVAGPEYGIALISRVPVAGWHVLGLRRARGRYPLVVPGPRPRVHWLPDEPRAAVAAVLVEPAITVACAHLSFVPGVNVRQLRQVVRWLRTLPGPRILLGDLNLPGRLPVRITGWTPLADGPTYPSPAPRLQLDHVLADGLPDHVRPAAARTVRLPASDHCAVLLDLPRT